MTGTVKGGANWVYRYTSNDQLLMETLTIDGRTYASRHGYNATSSRTSLTFPNGSRAVFAPDGFGRSTRVQGTNGSGPRYADFIDYHPNNAIASVDYLNGQLLTQSLNARQFISQISVQKGSNAAVGLNYSYDADARITAITDSVNPSQNRAFTYDALDRLIAATGPWGPNNNGANQNAQYIYDALGNNSVGRKSGFRFFAYPDAITLDEPIGNPIGGP